MIRVDAAAKSITTILPDDVELIIGKIAIGSDDLQTEYAFLDQNRHFTVQVREDLMPRLNELILYLFGYKKEDPNASCIRCFEFGAHLTDLLSHSISYSQGN